MYPYNFYRMGERQQQTEETKITVQGNGTLEVKPDLAIIRLGTVTSGKDVEEVQKMNDATMQEVQKAIATYGIPDEDMKTIQYNIYPKYDYVDDKKTLAGYEVTHIIEVEVKDLSLLDDIITSAIEAGANMQLGIEFTLQSPTDYYRVALNEAVIDGQEKAKEMATTLGISINPIPITITENTVYSSSGVTTLRSDSMVEGSSVAAGTVEVKAAVIEDFKTI